MSNCDPVHDLSGHLWTFTRITRVERSPLGQQPVDSQLLQACACDHQGLLIDRCPPERAAHLVCGAHSRPRAGITWVIAAGETGFSQMRQIAQDMVKGGRWSRNHMVYDVHPDFMMPQRWQEHEIRILLTTAADLRERCVKNPRTRSDVLSIPAGLLALIDPELSLCTKRTTWDPAWVVRDLIGRICGRQDPIPVVIFTRCDAGALLPSVMYASLGLDGLLYLDGATGNLCA